MELTVQASARVDGRLWALTTSVSGHVTHDPWLFREWVGYWQEAVRAVAPMPLSEITWEVIPSAVSVLDK